MLESRFNRTGWRVAVVVAGTLSGVAAIASRVPVEDPRTGQWDGKTLAATLAGPYVDPLQAQVPFGRRSFYLTPWRSYMDTWTGTRLTESIGINFNVDAREAEPTAQMLEECGIKSARIEIGWGSFQYDKPELLKPEAVERWTTILTALKKHHIRPLILLNGNSGAPCPLKTISLELKQPAAKGDTTVVFKSSDGIILRKTGFKGQAYQTAYPLIVSVDQGSGKCKLSAPLKSAIPAGNVILDTLKYEPFAGKTFANGTDNPASAETVAGWMSYVKSICQFARDICADPAAGEMGFDLEVWNEYTFGSEFLSADNYYSPAIKYKDPVSYTSRGLTVTGTEAILPMTVDYANAEENALIGVGVINGFSNQRPWDNGAESWPGLRGFSRHYYTDLQPENVLRTPDPEPKIGPLSALGQPDGKPDNRDWNTVVPGSFFYPNNCTAQPEFWHYSYKTEFVTRDLQPFPGPMKNHYRFSRPTGMRPPQVWMTETNSYRKPWMDSVIKSAACRPDDVRAVALSHAAASRMVLRTLVFGAHKGIHTTELFAAKEDDLAFAFFPQYFFQLLAQDNFQLTPRVRAAAGAQWSTVKNLTHAFRVNRRQEREVPLPRPLEIGNITEHKPRLVFKGDGTLAHPDRFNRDDLAILPFQLSEQRFAVGYYVATHNPVHSWQPGKPLLDPARYTMPDQEFDVTIKNVRGISAAVTSYDPIMDHTDPVKVVASTNHSITVKLQVSDYPRILYIREIKPGIHLMPPVTRILPGARMSVQIASNAPCDVLLTYGALPDRKSEKSIQLKMKQDGVVTIPLPAEAGSGYKITATSEGLTARWPLWDYDSLGNLPAVPANQANIRGIRPTPPVQKQQK